MPIKLSCFPDRNLPRRLVSVKWELPLSMMRSPGDSNGKSSRSTASTGSPAATSRMRARGRRRRPMNSCRSYPAWMGRAPTSFSMKSLVFSVVRLYTATANPWSAMFRTKLRPMVPRPIKPMSQPCVAHKRSPFNVTFSSRTQGRLLGGRTRRSAPTPVMQCCAGFRRVSRSQSSSANPRPFRVLRVTSMSV